MATTDKTKNEGRVHAVVAIALGAAVWQAAAAQDSQRLTVDVHDCLALEKRDERLACFEAQVEAAQRAAPARGSEPVTSRAAPVAPSAAPAAPSAAPAAPSPAPTARSTAPVAPSAAPVVESPTLARSDEDFGRAERKSEKQPVEMLAKVAELRETLPNAYVITLDNGQVWRQSQPMAYPLRPGLDVRLRQTKFGYRLSAPELRGQIPVERVR
jgi:hypothetical protein